MKVRENTLTLMSALIKLLWASPPLALGVWLAFIANGASIEDGQSLGYVLSLVFLMFGGFTLIRGVLLTLPISYRNDRLYLFDRIPLTDCPPTSILVKYDVHAIWKTYIVSGKRKILIWQSVLHKGEIKDIADLANRLGIPIYQQEFFSKPKRVYWKKKD